MVTRIQKRVPNRTLAVIISLLLGYFLVRTTLSDQTNFRVQQTLETGIAEWANADLESFDVEQGGETLVTATLRTSRDVTQADVEALDAQLEESLNRPVRLQLYVVPVAGLDSAPP